MNRVARLNRLLDDLHREIALLAEERILVEELPHSRYAEAPPGLRWLIGIVDWGMENLPYSAAKRSALGLHLNLRDGVGLPFLGRVYTVTGDRIVEVQPSKDAPRMSKRWPRGVSVWRGQQWVWMGAATRPDQWGTFRPTNSEAVRRSDGWINRKFFGDYPDKRRTKSKRPGR